MGIETKDPTLLAEQAKRMAGNLANDLTMLRNLSTALGAKARALEADPGDGKLASQVASLMDRVSAAYVAAKPDNPRFDGAYRRATDAASGEASLSELVELLHSDGRDRELELLAHALGHADSSCPRVTLKGDGGTPRLEVPVTGGKLAASFFGTPGIYDAIDVDYISDDGSARQCAVVERNGATGELHVYTWDGTSNEYSHHNAIDTRCTDGAYADDAE